MSKPLDTRDQIAVAAMQAILSGRPHDTGELATGNLDVLTRAAYAVADAMIAHRKTLDDQATAAQPKADAARPPETVTGAGGTRGKLKDY